MSLYFATFGFRFCLKIKTRYLLLSTGIGTISSCKSKQHGHRHFFGIVFFLFHWRSGSRKDREAETNRQTKILVLGYNLIKNNKLYSLLAEFFLGQLFSNGSLTTSLTDWLTDFKQKKKVLIINIFFKSLNQRVFLLCPTSYANSWMIFRDGLSYQSVTHNSGKAI